MRKYAVLLSAAAFSVLLAWFFVAREPSDKPGFRPPTPLTDSVPEVAPEATESREVPASDIPVMRDTGYGSIQPSEIDELCEIEDLLANVVWRESEDFDISEYPRDYDALHQLAESGDGYAAGRLYSMVRQCGEFAPPGTYPDIDAAAEEFQREGRLPIYRDGKIVDWLEQSHIQEKRWQRALENSIRAMRRCEQLSMEQRAEAGRWLQVAKDNGGLRHVILQLHDAMEVGEFEALAEELWLSGNSVGLEALRISYLAGHDETMDPGVHLERKAIYVAQRLLAISESQAQYDGLLESRIRARIYEAIDSVRESVHEHEWKEVIGRAREILSSNPNCCDLQARIADEHVSTYLESMSQVPPAPSCD